METFGNIGKGPVCKTTSGEAFICNDITKKRKYRFHKPKLAPGSLSPRASLGISVSHRVVLPKVGEAQ